MQILLSSDANPLQIRDLRVRVFPFLFPMSPPPCFFPRSKISSISLEKIFPPISLHLLSFPFNFCTATAAYSVTQRVQQ